MRHGCPISPLIYIIQVGPLVCAIRNNEKIIGFPLPVKNTYSREIKSVTFNVHLDDSQIFNQTEDSVRETFKITSKFENASGAKIH